MKTCLKLVEVLEDLALLELGSLKTRIFAGFLLGLTNRYLLCYNVDTFTDNSFGNP